MDKDEIDFIERFLTRASIQKQWQYARAFVEGYGDRINEINRTYLINHVMRISADEPVYLANHASAAAMAARTTALGVGDKWLGCDPLYAGKMNFAIIKHDLWDRKTKKKTSVVEKIFHAKNRGGFIRETTLLASMSSDALRTPLYLGSKIVEPFYFEYAVFAEGSTPSLDVFERKFQHRALRFLWGSAPTQALLDAVMPNRSKSLNWDEVVKNSADVAATIPGSPKALQQDALETLLRKAIQVYESSPDTVFHDDLHRGNVIAKGDDFFIIDWDKWIYEKPGAGAVYNGDEDRGAVMAFLDRAYGPDIKIGMREFQSNYLLFNLNHALQKKKPARAGFFAGLLMDIG
jgi:hypothetical protein